MRLMSDRAYAYAYGRLYIDGPLALEIDQSSQSRSHQIIQSNRARTALSHEFPLDAVRGAAEC